MNQNSITVGVDLGGTSTRIGLCDCNMRLLATHSMPTRVKAGPQSVVDEISEAIHRLLSSQLPPGTDPVPVGIGIGSPGPINLRTGVLGLLPNLPGWDNFPLRDALRLATGLPVTLESDANAAALAEWKLGAGKSTSLASMAMLTLGTGVGSGIILDGKVWQGMFGMGGEVGHATVDPEGLLCGCGSRGCLEMYASANGLIRLAQGIALTAESTPALRSLCAAPEGFTPLDVAQLAQAGDASAALAFERLGYYLGIGIANLINTLDLPMVIVGGGVASAWPLFAESMYRTVREYSVVYRLVAPSQRERLEADSTFICPATLGPAAGLLGAGLLPRLVSMGQCVGSVQPAPTLAHSNGNSLPGIAPRGERP
jgi:glucokinase